MDLLVPIVVAVVTTAGGIIATALFARRLGRLGLGEAQLQVNKTLRELAEAKSAEAEIWAKRAKEAEERHARELAEVTAERNRYRILSDDQDRRLNNLYAELRRTGKLDDRRSEPRGS